MKNWHTGPAEPPPASSAAIDAVLLSFAPAKSRSGVDLYKNNPLIALSPGGTFVVGDGIVASAGPWLKPGTGNPVGDQPVHDGICPFSGDLGIVFRGSHGADFVTLD